MVFSQPAYVVPFTTTPSGASAVGVNKCGGMTGEIYVISDHRQHVTTLAHAEGSLTGATHLSRSYCTSTTARVVGSWQAVVQITMGCDGLWDSAGALASSVRVFENGPFSLRLARGVGLLGTTALLGIQRAHGECPN